MKSALSCSVGCFGRLGVSEVFLIGLHESASTPALQAAGIVLIGERQHFYY